MLAGEDLQRVLALAFAPLLVHPVEGDHAAVNLVLQKLPDAILAENRGRPCRRPAFGAKPDASAIGQVYPVGVQPFGDLAIAVLAGEVPGEHAPDRLAFHRVDHQMAAVPAVGPTVLRAVVRAVGVGAGRTAPVAIAQGDAAVTQALAGTGQQPLVGLAEPLPCQTPESLLEEPELVP